MPAAYNDYVGGEIRNPGSSYSYGVLTGVVSSDTISYKITVPGDDSKIWNTGNSTYSNTGTGANQTFPIKTTVTGNYPTRLDQYRHGNSDRKFLIIKVIKDCARK